METKERVDVYQIVTDRIVAELEKGHIPWHRPWKNDGGDIMTPLSAQTGKAYRGINHILLAMAGASSGYQSAYWLTFKQALAFGGAVRKGEHGMPVTFWKFLEKPGATKADGTLEVKRIPMLRYYTVFNLSQCDNVKMPERFAAGTEEPTGEEPERTVPTIDAAESLAVGYLAKDGAPRLTSGGSMAYYRPADDTIKMPERESFDGSEGYYSTLFHELVHSTGAEKRLDRIGDSTRFGSGEYAREELVAEFGAMFLCASAGISSEPLVKNAAAYVQGWSEVLRNPENKRWIVVAAGAAQKAADLVTGAGAEPEPVQV